MHKQSIYFISTELQIMTIMLLFLLFFHAGPAQAQSCVAAPGGKYAQMSQGYIPVRSPAFSDVGCSNSDGTVGVGTHGWVYTTSGISVAAGICLSNLGGLVTVDDLPAADFYSCSKDEEDDEDDEDDEDPTQQGIRSESGRSGGDGSGARVTQPGSLLTDLGLAGLRIHAFDGMNSGIQFRRLGPGGIGIQSVLNLGFVDAVDVWGKIGSGYTVCFPQFGRVLFLNAATSPRSVESVENWFNEGYTCASRALAGTLVLVKPGESQVVPEATSAVTTVAKPGTDDSIDDAIDLENCIVTTLVNLRLRRAPWGTIRVVIPLNTSLIAMARTKHWFNVSYNEKSGWSAAWLMDTAGACSWRSSQPA